MASLMLISPLAFSQEELPPVTVYPDNWGSTLTSLDLTTTYQQDGAGGGGGGLGYNYSAPHASHNYQCGGGGGLSARMASANTAFRAARNASQNIATFAANHRTGSLYANNGAHYRVHGPLSNIPLSHETEGCTN